MNKPWAGRFKEKTEKIVEDFTSSIAFDVRLWKYDIEGSIAHAKMLGRQKIISKKDMNLIIRGLGDIYKEIEAGRFRFKDGLEDIHMNIEHALIKKVGAAGGKLHTARSRNDQVALDVRLYLRDEIHEILKLIINFRRVLVSIAKKHINTVMPGYTHLQRAQPVLLSHHFLAYHEMLGRDMERVRDCLKRVNVLPLGAAALAGTTLPINRNYVAKLLKFPEVSENSMDSVSDRDFIAEFIAASSITMGHLSRLSEELILWSSEEFGFIELPEAFATGSSIMPQKKNPDIPELVRGKTGRVVGNLMAIFTVMKGLPLAYNRDMQEDKEPLFDTVDTVKACISVLSAMLPRIRFRKKVMAEAVESGFMTATDVAEYLVKKGMPFREAHGVTGAIVRYCIENKKDITDMTVAEFQDYSDYFKKDIVNHITVQASLEGKKSQGSTSGKMVSSRIRNISNRKG
ncbi:MAG: argininosuccinate lyase [Nitrospiraceae bacterium]|nr:MAG: argininosuccinate lyase [Nitrospiraceae bacterium]